MTHYQVLARRYRPQSFRDVLGQEAIVTTLKNAIRKKRIAHAYLFCGPKGTGKTSIARILAKALNCRNRSEDFEPCNNCSSCKEITASCSLDVIEIDGASHRGIEDIRQINDNVGFGTTSSEYKIYIIDEVHMLTKEAFNALLKTLEEPPPQVKFLFATTEIHKVLPTILSRCQRFNLSRIPEKNIGEKLSRIAEEQKITVSDRALQMIVARADGGLRDAESIFDQIISFHGENIKESDVAEILGVMPKEILFELDIAGREGNFTKAFEIAEKVFSEGKDLLFFLETLVEHFRNILLLKLPGNSKQFLSLSENDLLHYTQSAEIYTKEQCLTIIDHLLESQNRIRHLPSTRIALESILLYILRIHLRIPVDLLVRRLSELESSLRTGEGATTPGRSPAKAAVAMAPTATTTPPAVPAVAAPVSPSPTTAPQLKKQEPQPVTLPTVSAPLAAAPPPKPKAKAPPPPPIAQVPPPPPPPEPNASIQKLDAAQQSRVDTVLQFTTVEFDGTLTKK